MNEAQVAAVNACSEEINGAVTAAAGKHDVRHVLAALGASLATISSAAMAAGVERRFVLEIMVGTLDFALTPPEKAPVVMYMDEGQIIGRKQ